MAKGLLGQATLTADTWSEVYDIPAGQSATFNINVVNRNASSAAVSIAFSSAAPSGSPEAAPDGTYVEYQAAVAGSGGVLERTAFVLQAGYSVYVLSDQTDVDVNVYGFTVSE